MIILGIDPGTATTGFGVIEKSGQKLRHLAHGTITTPKTAGMPARLLTIYTELNNLIDLHHPEVIATEHLFFSKNVTTGMLVSRTVGVILLIAAQRNIPWIEYRPAEVKMAVVGYGAAEKKQVQFMVKQILSLTTVPKSDDAADALALAICHAHSSRQDELVLSRRSPSICT